MGNMYWQRGVSMLKDLIELSRYYGRNSEYTIAGGGNSSWKEGNTMMVKASGFSMGNIGEDGFVAMDIGSLKELWKKNYPGERSSREAQFLSDIENAREEGETLRPSVETLLHQLFPYSYVIHTHPTLINGLGCSSQGKKLVQKLFGDTVFWVPSMDPGYYLAATLYSLLFEKQRMPQVLILQNHGLFVAANTKEEVYTLHTKIMDKLIQFFEGRKFEGIEYSVEDSNAFPLPYAAKLSGQIIDDFTIDSQHFASLQLPLTPDQIVYAGPEVIWLEGWFELESKSQKYFKKWRKLPQVFGVRNHGIYVLGESEKSLHTSLDIIKEVIRTVAYATLAGGVKPLSLDEILFIHNWEAEHYRSKVHIKKS